MREININNLINLERKYGCKLFFPPIFGNLNFCFCIKNLSNDHIKLRKFLIEIKGNGIDYNFIEDDRGKYLVVEQKQTRGIKL